MGPLLTYVVLGTPEDLNRIPSNGQILFLPRSKPNAASLYRAKLDAVRQVQTKYFCILDGGEDQLLDNFETIIDDILREMISIDAEIGFMQEKIADKNLAISNIPHHGVICNKYLSWAGLDYPKGCYDFETLTYNYLLAQNKTIISQDFGYEWNPTPGGARLWPDNLRGRVNSYLFLEGKSGIHYPSDFVI